MRTGQTYRQRRGVIAQEKAHVGAVAFSSTGDLATGDFGDAKGDQEVRRRAGRFERVVTTVNEAKLIALST
jgi:hypothetical protein